MLEMASHLHRRTERDYFARMNSEKPHCIEVAKLYGEDFWDGERKYGYGGYLYDGRWESVARNLIEHYDLGADAKILDVGCGKGFLLYEFQKLLSSPKLVGIDTSSYAIERAKDGLAADLLRRGAQDTYPFDESYFDLVVSIDTLHNLSIGQLKAALAEVERVGKNKFILVESFRNEAELVNLQCWALTCKSFYSPEDWKWLFAEFGYSGDHEFIYFE